LLVFLVLEMFIQNTCQIPTREF